MIKNNRFETIVENTKGINTLLDIGCDHGLVIKMALDNNYIKSAIASDINIEPLNSAKKNLIGYPVEFVLGNGFKNVKSRYDGVVIAGMGANLISTILEDVTNDEDIIYILQANNKYERLRYFLSNNNFKIIDETIIYDNYYYILIKAVKGSQVLTDEEIFLGPILMKKASSIEYYKHVLDHYNSLYKIHNVKNKRFESYIKYLSDIIDNYAV